MYSNFLEAYQTYLGTLLWALVLLLVVFCMTYYFLWSKEKRKARSLERQRLFDQLKMEK